MEKVLVLKAELRERTGSKDSEKTRSKNRIPAVIYGHKREPVSVSLDEHDFVEGLHHGNRIMDIQMNRKKDKVIVKDLQYDHLGKKIIHADLMRVDVAERLKVAIPVELKGIAQGTQEGGIIEEHIDRIEVECLVSDIPETIVVSVKDIGIGDSIHAGDIELPADMKLVSDPSTVIVTCSMVAAAKAEETVVEEAVEAEPEVIGRKKEEEEEKSEE